ncbi:MFS transporter, partial [Methylobacterium trifolii]
RIAPDAAAAAGFRLGEEAGTAQVLGGLRLVLSRSYRLGSAMLWIAYFMGLVIFYALINWMPILFRDAGLDPRTAALIAALFPLGGVGAILLGALMDRFEPNLMVAGAFALTALAVAAIGQAGDHVGLLMLAVFVAGTLMNTAQSSLPALAAGFYPTPGRATGVAWMLGLGRFGGIAGSFLVAELAGRALGLPAIFAVVGLPALIAAGLLVVKRSARTGIDAAPGVA